MDGILYELMIYDICLYIYMCVCVSVCIFGEMCFSWLARYQASSLLLESSDVLLVAAAIRIWQMFVIGYTPSKYQWIGSWKNPQETIDFPIKHGVFL